MQENDVRMKASKAARRRRDRRVDRADIGEAAPLFIHTPSCFRKDLMSTAKDL